MPPWGPDDIGDLTGRTALVTGANSGIGYEAALELAAHGAHVVLGCRNTQRAEIAADRMVGAVPTGRASLEVLEVDLADLDSVRRAAADFTARHARLDILVNNAGIMGVGPQLATNHLGPFALTGLVLDRILTTPGARVVTVSSVMHRIGRVRATRIPRNRWLAYGNTKLANLLFTYELDRRFRALGTPPPALAVAVHPGWAGTNLFEHRFVSRLGQAPERAALPTLYAATAKGVVGGTYFGPRAILLGPPRRVRSAHRARSAKAGAALWRASEDLTGVEYHFTPPAPLVAAPPATRADAPASPPAHGGGGTSPSSG